MSIEGARKAIRLLRLVLRKEPVLIPEAIDLTRLPPNVCTPNNLVHMFHTDDKPIKPLGFHAYLSAPIANGGPRSYQEAMAGLLALLWQKAVEQGLQAIVPGVLSVAQSSLQAAMS